MKPRNKGCIFCKIHSRRRNKSDLVLIRSSQCYALLNTYPYNNGHTMIVFNRHVGQIEKLTEREFLDSNRLQVKMVKLLKDILNPQGFNIGINVGQASGCGIKNHLHIHIVPRWPGDTNFMPVVSQTKIISQSLRELYSKLKESL
ncbi:MAG: HIT domain-containing protein [Candidatus Omnitrophota bacterium]